MSRKDIDDLTEVARKEGARGLAYIIYDDKEEGGKKSPILKFMAESEIAALEERLQPKNGDIVFFSADEFKKAIGILNKVRLALRDKFNLADPKKLALCWIIDFPMFEHDEEADRWVALHHPFTANTFWLVMDMKSFLDHFVTMISKFS
mgnify:CR=1 FL=1